MSHKNLNIGEPNSATGLNNLEVLSVSLENISLEATLEPSLGNNDATVICADTIAQPSGVQMGMASPIKRKKPSGRQKRKRQALQGARADSDGKTPSSFRRRGTSETTTPSPGNQTKRQRFTPVLKSQGNREEGPGLGAIPILRYNEVVLLERRVLVKDKHKALDEGQHLLLHEQLVRRVITTPCASGEPLAFEGCGLYKGMLSMRCANDRTLKWVFETVPTLHPWEGAELECIHFSDLPRPVRGSVFVPGPTLEPSEILKGLENQNPGLKTDGWIIFGQKREPKGILLHLGLDEPSVPRLEALGFKPFFALSRVTIKVAQKEIRRVQGKLSSTTPS
jgi:hypothetical protein